MARMAARSMVCILLLCAAVSMAACGTAERTSGPAPDKLKLIALPILSWAPFYFAEEEGYFEEQNLEVEFIRLARTTDALPALAQGDVDIGAGLLTAGLMNLISEGARLRFVADKGHLAADGCSHNAILVRRSLVEAGVLDDPAQIRGLRIETNRFLPEAFYADRVFNELGLSLDDLEIITLPPSSEADALAGGSIDMTAAAEPDITRLLMSGEAVLWKRAEEVIPGTQWSAVLYGRSLLDERPEVGERFMVAYLMGVRQFNEGKTPRNLEILTRRTGLGEELLKAACWAPIRDDGRVDAGSLLGYQEWAVSRGIANRILSNDELVDHRFTDHANGVLAR
jgi:ABC-type nitrate/sulfonate/bicarbonate transport system substrate-binding protein